MKTGDIIFYKANRKSLISRLISFVSKSDYTHVAIAYNGKKVLEANRFIKSRIVDLEIDDNIHYIYRIKSITFEQEVLLKSLIKAFEGYPYDYAQIYKWFMKLVFKRDTSITNNMNALFCAEIIDYVLYNGNVPRKQTHPLGDILPHMLLEVYDAELISERF